MTYDDALFLQLLKRQKVVTRPVIIDILSKTMRHWAYNLGLPDRKFESWVANNVEKAVEYVEEHGIKVIDISC